MKFLCVFDISVEIQKDPTYLLPNLEDTSMGLLDGKTELAEGTG
jgi:hypothetical protein